METTTNRRQNADNHKLGDKMESTTNWKQIGDKQIFRCQTKTWRQTGDSEPIKGLSQLALSLSLSLTSLL